MKHLFIPSELAIWAEELGFKEDCLGYYNEVAHTGKWAFERMIWENATNYVPAPLYQQITDWLRQEHGIEFEIFRMRDFGQDARYNYAFTKLDKNAKVVAYYPRMGRSQKTKSYDEALIDLIISSFQLLEKQKNE